MKKCARWAQRETVVEIAKQVERNPDRGVQHQHKRLKGRRRHDHGAGAVSGY